jgi:uncharacterized protein (DUF1697 family)
MANCPFEVDSLPEKERPYIALLSEPPSAEGIERLESVPLTIDEYRIVDRQVYLFYRQSVHKSKLTNNLLEKKLGVTATTRNWNTMSKLLDMAKAMQSHEIQK